MTYKSSKNDLRVNVNKNHRLSKKLRTLAKIDLVHFCLLEALTIKQTEMGLDFLNMHFEGNDLFQLFRG